MDDKKVINCITGKVTYEDFTQIEIDQREHEASLPPVIPPVSDSERIASLENMINALMMM